MVHGKDYYFSYFMRERMDKEREEGLGCLISYEVTLTLEIEQNTSNPAHSNLLQIAKTQWIESSWICLPVSYTVIM